MRNKSKLLTEGILLAVAAALLLFAAFANGQPASIPGNPTAVNVTPAPAPAPAPPVAARPQSQPSPQAQPAPQTTITVPPYFAQAIKDAIDKLPAEDTGTWGSFFRIIAANHPTLALLIGLRGLFGIVGLPIHTYFARRIQKHLSVEQQAKVRTDGSSVFKTIDWLVNLVFSIKPSTVMAASSIPKASVTPSDASLDAALARALARFQTPPPAIPPDPVLKQ
jgi:hypothetical protein